MAKAGDKWHSLEISVVEIGGDGVLMARSNSFGE
jgi:hypothetical protein